MRAARGAEPSGASARAMPVLALRCVRPSVRAAGRGEGGREGGKGEAQPPRRPPAPRPARRGGRGEAAPLGGRPLGQVGQG